MANTVSEQTAENASNGVAEEPCSVSQWLSGSLIPHGDDDTGARRDSCFSHSQEESIGKKSSCIEADCCKDPRQRPGRAICDCQSMDDLISWKRDSH